MAINISTIANGNPGAAFDYGSVAAWEAATDIDLVTPSTSEFGELHDDGGNFAETIIIAGATVNSSFFRKLYGTETTFGQGTFGGISINASTNGIVYDINENFHRLETIRINNFRATGTGRAVDVNGGSDCRLFRLELHRSSSGSGFVLDTLGNNGVMIDCVFDDGNGGTSIQVHRDQSNLIDNCVFGRNISVYGSSGTNSPRLRNCVVGEGFDFAISAGAYAASSTNNSGDSTSTPPGSNPLTDVVNATDFIDHASKDWRGKVGASFEDEGADLSVDFSVDIANNPWFATWDRGISRIGTAAAGSTGREYPRGLNRGVLRGVA